MPNVPGTAYRPPWLPPCARSCPAWPMRSSPPSARACPSTPATSRGLSAKRSAWGWPKRCASSWRWSSTPAPGAGRGGTCTWLWGGARCAPAAASTHCSRPTGSGPGWRGDAWPTPARPPDWSRAPSTCSRSRSSPTSTRSRASRSRATPPSRRLRLGEGAIATPAPPGVCALVPDPDAPGRRQELLAAAGERPMALGPTVPWPEAATSAARARLAARLAVEGLIGEAGGLIAADDYSLTLLTHADPGLAADLADRALKPLEGETPASRARLSATLHAWLREQGRTEAVARELHVHPQTVRYRLGRLRELFGDVLERPDGRFELEVALRAGARQVGGPEPGR